MHDQAAGKLASATLRADEEASDPVVEETGPVDVKQSRAAAPTDIDATSEGAEATPGPITGLLASWAEDHRHVGEALYPLVYDELRQIAACHLRGERRDHTLQPTALVNETYLELDRQRRVRWSDRQHFFRLASHLMRRILKLHARNRNAQKRGGGMSIDSLVDDPIDHRAPGEDALVLGRLVEELAAIDPFKAELVRLRALEELTVPECAERLGVATATIDRHWRMAKAWLRDAFASR